MILVSHRLTLQRLKQVQRVLPLGLSRELRETKISHSFHEVFTSACSRQDKTRQGMLFGKSQNIMQPST